MPEPGPTDVTALPPASAEPSRCRAVRADGQPCESTTHLSAEGYCLFHDPLRTPAAAAARAQGTLRGNTSPKRGGHIYRIVADKEMPPLTDMDDAVSAAAWVFRMTGNGTNDPVTSRELNRSITTFKDALNKRDLLRRIRELERQVKVLKQHDARP